MIFLYYFDVIESGTGPKDSTFGSDNLARPNTFGFAAQQHLLAFVLVASLTQQILEEHFFPVAQSDLKALVFVQKTTFQTFLCLFAIRKVDQWKTLSCQKKIWLDF